MRKQSEMRAGSFPRNRSDAGSSEYQPWSVLSVRPIAGRVNGATQERTPGSVGHSTAARGRLAVTVKAVKHGHQIACQEERGRHAADHDDGQRLRRLAADFGRD